MKMVWLSNFFWTRFSSRLKIKVSRNKSKLRSKILEALRVFEEKNGFCFGARLNDIKKTASGLVDGG
jgi:hypothetical protein